ncbi:MAG: purine-binding chemotaxis protein CheW [Spirochaetes bacterium]|nr:purine-binding chemotaxis protein CheW [Spirochaetota bacterium]
MASIIKNEISQDETAEQYKDFSQYLTFTLRNDIYGIKVHVIREVGMFGKVFTVPKSPDCIRGIINLRGNVIPVIDLNSRLFGTESIITRMTNIVVVEVEQENEKNQIGVIIDSVKEVVDVPEGDTENTPGFGLNLRSDFVEGIAKVKDDFIILLDMPTVLNVDEISRSVSSGKSAVSSALSADNISGRIRRDEKQAGTDSKIPG